MLQAEGVAQITAQVIKQQDDELQEASSYYKVRTHGEKVEGKRGGGKKITQDMYYADEPEYYSAHNKEPLKSFKQGSNILRFTFFN